MNSTRPDTRSILDRVIDSIERMLGRKMRLAPAPVRVRVSDRPSYPSRISVDRRL